MSPPPESRQILAVVRRARRRLQGQRLLEETCRWGMITAAAAAFSRAFIGSSPATLSGAAAFVAIGMAVALTRSLRRRPSLQDGARALDARLALSARTETALEHLDGGDPFAVLLLRDAAGRLRAAQPREIFPLRPLLRRGEMIAAAIVLAIALVVPSWSGHPQGFGLLRPLGERLSARASGPAPTPGPAGAEPALSADATTSPAAGRPNALDPGAPAPPTDSKDADTSPSASPAATNEPTRPGEEPRLAALQPPLRDVLRQMMARGGRAAGSGDDSEATPPTGAAASAAEPPADASAPAPRAGTQPADVRATRSEELFTGYEIPLRLRAYVRDYLLAIGGSR